MARRSSKRRPRSRKIALAAVIVIVAFLVATTTLFVLPATNSPAKVNAIVVLGGAGNRIQKGIELAKAGYAPVLLVSTPDAASCPYVAGRAQVICFDPHPSTTQGEAREAARLAAKRGWTRLLVVADLPQTTRARIRFDRCYRGTVLFDPVSPGGPAIWLYSLAYEWGAIAKAFTTQRGC